MKGYCTYIFLHLYLRVPSLCRRFFVSDANMNRMWFIDSFGSIYRYIDLQQTIFGDSSKIFLPTDVAARVRGDSAEIFVAEYLG